MVKGFVYILSVTLGSCCVLACTALAATPGPGWSIDSLAIPSSFSEAENAACAEKGDPCDSFTVTIRNAGSRPTDGSAVTIADTLPEGLMVSPLGGAQLLWSGPGAREAGLENIDIGFLCETKVTPLQCQFPLPVGPDETLRLKINVMVEPGAAATFTNTASVSGGGAGQATERVQNANGTPPPFGMSAFSALVAGTDGASDTQAGDHPYEFTTRLNLASSLQQIPEGSIGYSSVRDPKDIVLDLPLGFVGSTLAASTCTLARLTSAEHCPPAAQIGFIRTEPVGQDAINSPLYNIVPERGVAAEYGFFDEFHSSHVIYASVAPTPAGYVLRATSPDVTQIALTDIVADFYGDPAARSGSGNTALAQFTNPADCTGEPRVATVHMDSWQNPGSYNADGSPDFADPGWTSATSSSPAVTGCDQLRFGASIGVRPETAAASTPSGLDVELQVPQSQTPGTLGTPPLRRAVVTLPAGLAVNPSAAGGLQACSQAQIGLGDASQPACPEASKIGSVEITTPAVAGVLQGSVYLAAQNENPFHTLLAGYIVVDDPTTGVLLKIPGRIDPDPVTGQLTATFDQAPQFPFSDLKIHLFGGPRAPLRTPAGCGTYPTSATLTPWSAPDSGPPTSAADSFPIDSGCANGFAPSFAAGTVSNQAGGFSPFTVTLARGDGDQNLSGVTVRTPPGLLGILRSVERCPEPQASQGACGSNSLIGHTTVAAGSGPDPFWVQGGQVYLTAPYRGAPFGLSIVVPAVAGPFNLGNVVVRAAIGVDPHTAQITVSSDPLPTILQGIPLDVRTVNVAIDRAGFIFNPTSCQPLSVGGTLTSAQGATANVSSRFQAANCANLAFKPSFTVSSQASTSKRSGASLDVKVGYPKGAQANIHSVAVTLPKQLPARLTTIQQACPQATFDANPASCPAGSVIGTATANTPILANPVTGPAYLVSHGGAAFPDLVLILQGEGVRLELTGSIDIKHGVTSSAFNSVPDAPISSFELKLPEGAHSGLAAVLSAKAKGNLCGTSLTMPTTLTGQNGAVLKQNTKIAVTGCAKAKKKAKKKHTVKGRKK